MAAPTITNLQADAVAKFSSKKLIQLTRPQSPSATTTDTTLLGKACEDSALYFQAQGGKDYDDTNSLHRQVALIGVEGFLKQYIKAASSELDPIFARYDQMLLKVREARTFRLSTQARTDDDDNDVMSQSFFDKLRPN